MHGGSLTPTFSITPWLKRKKALPKEPRSSAASNPPRFSPILLQVARALEIPTVVTEQYPKGLGPTVPELGAEELQKYSKTCFSMIIPEVEKEMAAVPNLKSVLLCGIETQACIMVWDLFLGGVALMWGPKPDAKVRGPMSLTCAWLKASKPEISEMLQRGSTVLPLQSVLATLCQVKSCISLLALLNYFQISRVSKTRHLSLCFPHPTPETRRDVSKMGKQIAPPLASDSQTFLASRPN